MAFEIVSEAKPKPDPKYAHTCRACLCTFTFLRSDAKEETHRNERYLNVSCPSCSCQTYIDYENYLKG